MAKRCLGEAELEALPDELVLFTTNLVVSHRCNSRSSGVCASERHEEWGIAESSLPEHFVQRPGSMKPLETGPSARRDAGQERGSSAPQIPEAWVGWPALGWQFRAQARQSRSWRVGAANIKDPWERVWTNQQIRTGSGWPKLALPQLPRGSLWRTRGCGLRIEGFRFSGYM